MASRVTPRFLPLFSVAGNRQRRDCDFRRGLSRIVLPLALGNADRNVRRCDRAALAHHGREFWWTRVTGRIGSVTVWGVIIPVRTAFNYRLAVVQTGNVCRSLESE